MIKIGTITLRGLSGNKYDFDVYKWGTGFHEFGAVYYISKRVVKFDGTVSHTQIYIGQTSNMSDRFDDHHKAKCFKDNDVNAISVHQDDDKDSRLEKEADLIGAHDPVCNS